MYTQNRTDGMIEPPVRIAPTGSYSHILRVNRFSFAAPECKFKSGKARNAFDAERAITDTITYLGFMSLKNSDHAGDKKDVTQATAQRAAADRLIAAGTVVLLGTWSNGIAVGPGAGFVACTNEPEVIAPAKKSRKANPNSTKAQKAAYAASHQEEHDAHASEEGATCDWQSTWHGPAFVAKPRVRVPLATMQPAHVAPVGPPPGVKVYDDDTSEFVAHYTDLFRLPSVETYPQPGERCIWAQEPAQPATAPPTPIYTPAVGDTIAITYQHERMTTDRVVTVQRVAADGKTFRGYDRTYDRVRNYDMARVVTIRRLGGEGVEIAAG